MARPIVTLALALVTTLAACDCGAGGCGRQVVAIAGESREVPRSLLGSAPWPGPRRTSANAPDDLSALLERVRADSAVPALLAAVINDDEIVALGAAGVRAAGHATRVTSGDRVQLASNTKAMTATLVASFVEAGAFDWDTPIAQVFPTPPRALHPELRDVTLRQLLTHQGGLPEQVPGPLWATLWDRATPAREQRARVAQAMLAQPPLHAPGSQFLYSNVGYMIVGAAIEQRAGRSFETLLRERVLSPLQMDGCDFGAAGTGAAIDQPRGHVRDGDGWRAISPDAWQGDGSGDVSDNPPAFAPAGTLHCTLESWARFLRDHMRGARGEPALLSPASYAVLHAPPAPGLGRGAMGWFLWDWGWESGAVLLHDGSNLMNFASCAIAPGAHVGFMIATNADREAGEAVKRATYEALTKRYGPPNRKLEHAKDAF